MRARFSIARPPPPTHPPALLRLRPSPGLRLPILRRLLLHICQRASACAGTVSSHSPSTRVRRRPPLQVRPPWRPRRGCRRGHEELQLPPRAGPLRAGRSDAAPPCASAPRRSLLRLAPALLTGPCSARRQASFASRRHSPRREE
ncbi:hypothetical protein BS78_01G180300 [Paspalum vaginatum]|nr:hypothetical protein BS78_01G180300 [Paspalum vaginatum]